MAKIKNIALDLDGTLIDSAPIILEGLVRTTIKYGYKIELEINNKLIGPPLIEVLYLMTGERSKDKLEKMSLDFKNYYDEEACLESKPYEGVENMLVSFCGKKINLYLATNKRSIPTYKILKKLGWTDYFKSIYSIDKEKLNPYNNKKIMLQALLENEYLRKEDIVYIGDRLEDKKASIENEIEFWFAAWGYENTKLLDKYSHSYNSPKEIEEYVLSLL